jgi:hypothetical protein
LSDPTDRILERGANVAKGPLPKIFDKLFNLNGKRIGEKEGGRVMKEICEESGIRETDLSN